MAYISAVGSYVLVDFIQGDGDLELVGYIEHRIWRQGCPVEKNLVRVFGFACNGTDLVILVGTEHYALVFSVFIVLFFLVILDSEVYPLDFPDICLGLVEFVDFVFV